ncbi:hypothetical protein P4N68_00280 [Corynebacterium felinum]|uniref:Secreted protein n=1 Tax=Corynebacterium felinum TaxID=131318 RepID=A0ABU2BEE3_9CORY|nr:MULTISPECIES: hypothetical protein [Corynebacterium]MDF5819520.1 hypothetical protein [Corynebacterium felinum]MDO4762148.1 hypothetical protein [Corynebacterium sp.]MDR7356098.1 hypothetical protein [Corynebacterium felinum]WJY95432.1 hypothetical protein CFELI_09140 [Corynebacterium felinum]
MTLTPRPRNPIEQRKQDVRKYSRNAVVSVAGGIGGGIVAALVFSSSFWLILGLIVAVVGGVVNYNKVKQIINHKDNF